MAYSASFGTGVAVALAREGPVSGVSAQRALCLGAESARAARAATPYRWLLTNKFDSEAMIGGIGVPVMILHGTAGGNVPINEARCLYATALEPKTMKEVEDAGHLDAWEGGARAPALRALVAWTAPEQRPPSTQ